jgi:hypothetical protein
MQLHEALASGNLSTAPSVVEVTTPRAVIPRGGRDVQTHHDSPPLPQVRPIRADAALRRTVEQCPHSGKELDDEVPHRSLPLAADRQVVAVILMILGGLGVLLLAAVVVGVVDAFQAASWREVAAERREQWESLHPQPLGGYRDDSDDD